MDWINKKSFILLLRILFLTGCLFTVSRANFYEDVEITWGHDHANISDDGMLLTLTLDRLSGAGFQSKKAFLFGKFDVDMKLPPGNSAGIVTTFYLTTEEKHEEIDLEFLGNLTDDPYTLHTNIYTHDVGHREQEFNLWFDPRDDFHRYSVLWNPVTIIVYVDNIPIRVFNNRESVGVPYPNTKPMRIKASIWNGEKWATRGGLVKTDWTQAPFTALYRNLRIQTLSNSSGGSRKKRQRRQAWPMTQELDKAGKKLLRWVRQTRMVYNYCNDRRRHPGECNHFIDI
ncbi:Xyloglucan endotransglucosylase protein 1 [Linum grandiflorum]